MIGHLMVEFDISLGLDAICTNIQETGAEIVSDFQPVFMVPEPNKANTVVLLVVFKSLEMFGQIEVLPGFRGIMADAAIGPMGM